MNSQNEGQGKASEEEKQLYRRKLAEWRDMGFDVSALEVLLETDLEKFKAQRFELMRSQIAGAPQPPSPVAQQSRQPSPALSPYQPYQPAARGGQPVPQSYQPLHYSPSAAPQHSPEHHSEMRYPSARRHHEYGKKVKTFSIDVEHEPEVARVEVGQPARKFPPKGTLRPSKLPPGKTVSKLPPRPPAKPLTRPLTKPITIPLTKRPLTKTPARAAPAKSFAAGAAPARTLPSRRTPAAPLPKKLIKRVEEETEDSEDMVDLEEEEEETEDRMEEVPEGEEEGEELPVVEDSEDEEDYLEEESTYDEYDREKGEEKAAEDETPEDVEEAEESEGDVEGRDAEEGAPEEEEAPTDEEEQVEEEGEEAKSEFDAEQESEQEYGDEETGDDEPPRQARRVRPVKRPGIATRVPMKAARPIVKKVPARKGLPPKKKKKGQGGTLLALIAVAVVVVAALGAWWATHPSETLEPRIWHTQAAVAGELVRFDARNSTYIGSPIKSYTWYFGDGAKAVGKIATHSYALANTYTVRLELQSESLARAERTSKITISPLSFTVPAKKLNDKARYDVSGNVGVHNNDTGLYTFTVGPSTVITVKEVTMTIDPGSTLNQWVWETVQKEDGYRQNHTALRTRADENLKLSGRAVTSLSSYDIKGELDYTEDSYSDPASGGGFQSYSQARSSISLLTGIIEGTSRNSTDSLRAYPNVAGITEQFQLERIYRDRKFDQSSDASLTGSEKVGNSTYSWKADKNAENLAGKPSLKLHITADQATMERYGLFELSIDVWVSGACSLPTKTHVHVAGRDGETSYNSDHIATMQQTNGYEAGTGTIDRTPQQFTSPALPGDWLAPMSDVPAAGNGSTGLRFTPAEAKEAAASQSTDFAQFLKSNPQAYAVDAKYMEGTFGPQSGAWNLSFAWPGITAGSGYWVNVTQDLFKNYSMRGDRTAEPPSVKTSEASLSKLLTLTAAEGVFRSDPETASKFFAGGNLSFLGTTLSLKADHPYPSLNMVSMYAGADRAGYAALLEKEGYTSAVSMDSGQMMYYWTHAAN